MPFCIAGFVYSLKFAPETKKKTFLEIRKLLELFLSQNYVTEPPVVKKQAKKGERRKWLDVTGNANQCLILLANVL